MYEVVDEGGLRLGMKSQRWTLARPPR